jgi:hypothetical protein
VTRFDQISMLRHDSCANDARLAGSAPDRATKAINGSVLM